MVKSMLVTPGYRNLALLSPLAGSTFKINIYLHRSLVTKTLLA